MSAAPPTHPAIPAELREVLEANEAALRELAPALGGEVRPIDAALREAWLAPTSHYEPVRVLEGEHRGTRVAVVANFLRHSTSGRGASARVRWSAQHRVAAFRSDAAVPSVLQTASHTVPFVGELKVPHFEWGAQASSATESAWTLEGGPRPIQGPGGAYRFTGCYDGVLYATLGETALDRAGLEQALDALVAASALPWRAPSEEERASRRRRAMGRARRRLAMGCLINLAVVGLIGWGIYALVS